MSLQIDRRVLGPLATNCYLLRTGEGFWVVDPGLGPQPILSFCHDLGRGPDQIVLTHGHGDHIGGVRPLREAYPRCGLLCPAGDADMLTDAAANLSAAFGVPLTAGPADGLLSAGDRIELGQTVWDVLDTSGHTPGGVSLYCASQAVVLTGDALFAGSIGRTDIPGGDAGRLTANIRENLLCLPDETTVLSGHGPATTIGAERRSNPCL